ncbi:MAG: TerB family tellurite resistance protein [Spirochaetales bacterium]|nr:TerB family tellurite resistance protein [Spirochaetales bacterium]
MANIMNLSKDERIFLAGAIKSMILTDGRVTEEELQDIDDLLIKDGFDDFDERLADFEEKITNNDEFWALAASIKGAEAQGVILEHLYELSIQDGFPNLGEKRFLNDLQDQWGIEITES